MCWRGVVLGAGALAEDAENPAMRRMKPERHSDGLFDTVEASPSTVVDPRLDPRWPSTLDPRSSTRPLMALDPPPSSSRLDSSFTLDLSILDRLAVSSTLRRTSTPSDPESLYSTLDVDPTTYLDD